MNNSEFSTNPHLTENEVALAADHLKDDTYGALDDRIKDHIAECETCAMQVMEVVSIEDEIVVMDRSSNSKDGQTQKNLVKWLAAACLGILVASSILLVRLSNKNSAMSEVTIALSDSLRNAENNLAKLQSEVKPNHRSKTDSAYKAILELKNDSLRLAQEKTLKNQQLIAALYQPNKGLEEEMKLTLRSGALNLKQPNKMTYRQRSPLAFKWDSDVAKLNLVIYTNHGLKLITEMGVKNGFELDLKKLSIGRYYYQLFNENDLVKMGAFDLR